MKKRDYELGQILNAKKIADSMVFKTGISIIQLVIVLFVSIVFAQVMVGFDDLSAFKTGEYWANVLILFAEQFYIYHIFYDWLFTALTKSDERLVGDNDEKVGLNEKNEIILDAFETNDEKLENGLEEWNKKQKTQTYKDNVKNHITKIQNKLEKARIKNNAKKIKRYKERLKNAKALYNDKEVLNDIMFINVKNYKPMTYKDLVGDGVYDVKNNGHNTLIDLKSIRRKRILFKGAGRVALSIISGLLVFSFVIGGSGFWQRISVMLFAMSIQVIMAIHDAYIDNNVHIINQSLRNRALLFCTKYEEGKNKNTSDE